MKQNRTITTIDLVRREYSLPFLYMQFDYFQRNYQQAFSEDNSECFILQGGNNIHAKGVSDMAQVLKDNPVITTVSPPSFYHFSSFPFFFGSLFLILQLVMLDTSFFFFSSSFCSRCSWSLVIIPLGQMGQRLYLKFLSFMER